MSVGDQFDAAADAVVWGRLPLAADASPSIGGQRGRDDAWLAACASRCA
jgi:hypothetical protein